MSINNDKFSGNCGMYAIALGKYAKEQGGKVAIVIISNAENIDDLWEDIDIYHVAIEINGKLYDGRGETNENELIQFVYNIYGKWSLHIYYLMLNDVTITLIRQQTNWDTFWEDYYKEIKGA